MSINKAFVVKNSFEVSTDLILADADTRKVGIASTNPQYTLDVAGGIGATDFYLTGIGTFVDELNVGLGGTVLTVLGIGNSIGIGTALPQYLLDIRSPVLEGQVALYVQGDIEVTGDIRADDIVFDDAEIQDLTVTDTFIVAGLSTFNSNVFVNAGLNVSGVTTLGSYVDINNSADISGAINVGGLTTLGGYVDINNSVDVGVDLNVVGLTTLGGYVDINNSVDISTDLNVVGVTTLATVDINAGEIDVTRIETGDLSVTGIATLSTVDINAGDIEVSNVDTTDLNVTGIATIATISVVGAALSSLIVSGIATLGTVDINAGEIDVSRIETGDLSVTGISTLGTVQISSGIITATSGIVTYYGDGQYLDLTNNPSTGIGIGTTGGVVGYGITFIDFYGAGVSTTFYNSSVGIATIFFEGGGGGGGTIGIGTEFPLISENGDLFFSAEFGRLFIYYDENIIGVGTDAFWIDAAPFNIPEPDSTPGKTSGTFIATAGQTIFNYIYQPGFIDVFLNGIRLNSTEFIANNGTTVTLLAAASLDDVLDVVEYTMGIGTQGPIGPSGPLSGVTSITTDATYYPLFVSGIGSVNPHITFDNLNFNPFTGTLTINQLNVTGIATFTSLNVGNINSSGVTTLTSLDVGNINSSGIVTAVDFNATSDQNLKTNIHTVDNALETVSALRGVSFNWKENDRKSYGVIAQEIEQVLPELVSIGEIRTVNYNGIIGVLIEAVKELSAEIEELKSNK